jgi:hypothetical protein
MLPGAPLAPGCATERIRGHFLLPIEKSLADDSL